MLCLDDDESLGPRADVVIDGVASFESDVCGGKAKVLKRMATKHGSRAWFPPGGHGSWDDNYDIVHGWPSRGLGLATKNGSRAWFPPGGHGS